MKGRSRFRFRYRGIMGALAQALGSLFDKILNDEETAGNDNVFYNPQDLTSLRVGRDGSGGFPVVGDPVGVMLDTSGLSGSMEEFLASQPELVTNGTFDTDSDWVKGTGWTISGGQLSHAAGTASLTYQNITLTTGKVYRATCDVIACSGGSGALQFRLGGTTTSVTITGSDVGQSVEVIYVADGNTQIAPYAGSGTTLIVDNISVKEIPGNHAIAPSDAARPTLMDDPDTTWASLTDDGTRGEELVTNGNFSDGLTGWTQYSGSPSDIDTSSGAAVLTWGGANVATYQEIATEAGQVYELTADVTLLSGSVSNVYLNVWDGAFATQISNNQPPITTSNPITFVALGPVSRIAKYIQTSGTSASFDNISVRKVNTAFDSQPHLVTGDDSTFDTDTGNWSKGTGWSIGSGVASCDGTQTGTSLLQIPISAAAEKFYRVQVYVSGYSAGSLNLQIGSRTIVSNITANGHYNNIGRYSSGPATLYAVADASFVGSIDNIIVQELPTTTPTSYYLDVDGTDDWMEVTPTLDLGEQWWHTGGWRIDTEFRYAFSTSSQAQGGLSRNTNKWSWYDTSGTAVFQIAPGSPGDLAVITIEQHDTNSISGRTDGVSAVAQTPYDDTALTQGLVLFSRENDTYGSGLDGRFYGGAWGQGQVDYDELTTLQDYLGTLVEPDIDPTDVTSYANVYEMLSAQTAAALFDIDDTTSLRVETDGSGGVPVDGDPVGMMMDVSGTGGLTMEAYLEGATERFVDPTVTDLANFPLEGTLSTREIDGNGDLHLVGSTGNNGVSLSMSFGPAGSWNEITIVYKASALAKFQVDYTSTDNIPAPGTSGEFATTSAIVQSDGIPEALKLVLLNNTEMWIRSVSVKPLPGYTAVAASDAARPTLKTYNSPISSRDVLTTTYSWTITDGGRA